MNRFQPILTQQKEPNADQHNDNNSDNNNNNNNNNSNNNNIVNGQNINKFNRRPVINSYPERDTLMGNSTKTGKQNVNERVLGKRSFSSVTEYGKNIRVVSDSDLIQQLLVKW